MLAVSAPALAQRGALPASDSALAYRILVAEDRRDTNSIAITEGLRHRDPRIQLLARRAAARSRDARFAARDSLPPLPAPPVYPDPAWRLRYRALSATAPCATLTAALSDSVWAVRLRATDLIRAECARDSVTARTLNAWAGTPPANGRRGRGAASWHGAGHAIVALARIAPMDARTHLARAAASPVVWLRAYAARAAGTLADTATLRQLARDSNDNVKEAAISALSRLAGHAGDDEYIAALSAKGYQAVRAAAQALRGSPRGAEVLAAALAAARRLRGEINDASRDARDSVMNRIAEFASAEHANEIAVFTADFDCTIARHAHAIATRLGATNLTTRCTPMNVVLSPEVVGLAMGRDVRLRVTLADSSGGGSFVVKLRGDVAPIMASRVLALARQRYYNGLTWHRVEHDFVVQGGGPGANEYVGHPRFFRDELATVQHVRGTVGMSTRGHDTGDAQWFLNLRDNSRLTRDYTVFAEVVEGIDVIDGILEGDVIARIEVIR